MTPQRKAYLKRVFKSEEENLLKKIKNYKNIDNVRCVILFFHVPRYETGAVTYDFKKKKFINIFIINEKIEL